MIHFGQGTEGSSRIQFVLGAAIVLVGALSFAPTLVGARAESQAEEAAAAAAPAAPSMQWVVDPDHPGGVRLAPSAPEPADTVDAPS